MSNSYTEDHLVEQPAIQLMQHELGWDVMNCFGEWVGGVSDLGREGKREVVLTGRLKAALLSLNPDLPEEAIDGAVEEMGILNDEFWILNGRGRRTEGSTPLLLQIPLFHYNRRFHVLLKRLLLLKLKSCMVSLNRLISPRAETRQKAERA